MLIEVWNTGPIQIPFGFSMATKLDPIWFEDGVVNSWEAGDIVEVGASSYIVAKEILPNAGRISLRLER